MLKAVHAYSLYTCQYQVHHPSESTSTGGRDGTMAVWADQEVLKLVELWGEDSVQEQLEGCKRNSQVYHRIAREMQIAGFDRTGQQYRDKMKKLRSEYRKIKDSNSRMGESRSKWKFFEYMDAILG